MKNFTLPLFLLFFTFFSLCSKADIIPLSSRNIKYYGIGVLNMPQNYTVYTNPLENRKVISEVNYEAITKSAIVNSIDMRKISYVAFLPSENIALLTVDINADNGWYKVYINQNTGETGWVFNDNPDDFYTYRRLFYNFGKKYGIRMFNDLSPDKKVLFSSQSTTSQKLEQLTYPKYINFTVIQGNWLLATVNDMSKQAKVGWFNWRNDDGTLNMFPNFKE